MTEFMQAEKFWEDLKSGKFAQMVRESARGKEISNPVEAYHIVKPLFAEQNDVECMYGIFLDTRNHILAIEKISSGTLTCAVVYPRELVKRVIALQAGAIVLAHSHPSGNTEPSPEDRVITKKIVFALATIDVLLHDHLIVGRGYYCMSSDGWIESAAKQCRKFLANPT